MNSNEFRNNNYFPDNPNNFNFQSNYRNNYRGHGGGTRGQQPTYRRMEPYQQRGGYTENAHMFERKNNDQHQKWGSSQKWEDNFDKFKDPNKKKTRRKRTIKAKSVNQKRKPVHTEISPAATTTMLNDDQKSLGSPSGHNTINTHNIKREHIVEDGQEMSVKQQAPTASPNSLNSLIKSKSELSAADDVETTTNIIHTLNMANTQPKKEFKKSTDSHSSASSSATSEVDSESSCPVDPIVAKRNLSESAKTEEDIVCLGKLENKIVVEDDDVDDALQDSNSPQSSTGTDRRIAQCMICDKKGHSSFQCQMICMNCSCPYHNLKSCTKPCNLTVMLQTFMDFCMRQLMQYSPEQRFFTPQEVSANSSHFTPFSERNSACVGLPTFGFPVASTNSPKHKRTQLKSKNLKKKGKKRTKSQNSDDEDAIKRDSSVDNSSASDSKTDSSEELLVEPRAKRAKTKTLMQTAYNSPFSTHGRLPEYVSPAAAAAAYNPLMFNQLLHGAFPMHAPINFNR